MAMDVLRCCFLLGVFCINGVFCVQCTAFESTFSSNIVTFTCPETCCTSAYSRKCCSIEPIHGWLIAMAIIIPLLVLCCCCGIIIAVIKSCTRTGNKGRVIAPMATYTMPAPPAYSTYNATPPAYTASPVSANATGQTTGTMLPMQASEHRTTSTQGVYSSSNTTQLPPAVAFPPVGPTPGVPPASTTATSHPPPLSTTETSPAVGPTHSVPPTSTTATSHPPPLSTTETFPAVGPTPSVPPTSTTATSHPPPFSTTETSPAVGPTHSVPPTSTTATSHPPPFSTTETSPAVGPTSGVPPASTTATSHPLPFSMAENFPSGSVPPAGTTTT